MKVSIAIACSILGSCVVAEPFRYNEASFDVQEYVVDRITNVVTNATFAIMHDPYKDLGNLYVSPMHYHVRFQLGLRKIYCVEALKGDVSIGGYKECYTYDTSRNANELSPLCSITAVGGDDDFGGMCYFEGESMVKLMGRNQWLYDPPYDPYFSTCDDFAKFMILTPEHIVDVQRIKPDAPADGWTNTITSVIGASYTNSTPAEIMRKLNVESVFSNRVFRLNEGCSFQVDYPVPENNAWRGYEFETKEEYVSAMNRLHASNTSLMHLSPDEVSEITYLAYFADNVDTNGYNAACARCPLILRPVIEFKTTIGKRLRQAMSEGGMITTNNLPNVAAAP